ncbi:glycoside hydrolase family 172 protein [Jiangella asiatica]|uniref:DUF2961 domain-containing protein n=1 Tax=Jiangella asiatica TaxID=2530372 RepID=A0A4R5DAM4_9ACTN|nr:glycoside hydrolase family 172 protein [Jiangella asiatica]TDE09887.1 DUF2961 domain-containing protein [Jiangella asiatica]
MRAKSLVTAGALVALTVTGLTGVTGDVTADAEPTAGAEPASASTAKGPIGWDVYRRLDLLPVLPTGVRTLQFSSYDRTGGNADAVAGSCLRTTADGCVIAEASGAGEVQSIWFTRDLADPGNVTSLGRLVIELDGRVVVDAPAQDVVDGELGAPFVYPLVANRDQSSGGVSVRVPMPFRESMRITTTENAQFYHVTYRAFADAEGVRTFDPADRAEDVIAMLRRAGTADPKPPAEHPLTASHSATLPAGGSIELGRLRGPGVIDELALRIPQIVGPDRSPTVRDDGRGFRKPGHSQFTVAIDARNTGVRLTRRVNTFWAATQVADVSVDGVPAGSWPHLPSTNAPRWTDATLELPAALTAGRSSVTVHTDAVDSIFGSFEEFHYWVDSRVGDEWVRTDVVDIGPEAAESEAAHGYAIEGQLWAGAQWNPYPPTGEPEPIATSDALLRDLRVRVSVDGATTVDAPLGEFFGTGLGEYPVRSLFFAVDTAPDGWYRSWWPMPFVRSARVELVNTSDLDVELVDGAVRWHRNARTAIGLGPRGDLGTFRATALAGATVEHRDWRFLDTRGQGRFVGVSHTMLGEQLPGSINSRGYLEGDERVHVDGAASPQLHGTGTEDFYEGAWYFATGPFSNPFTGNTAAEVQELGCAWLCDSAYRLMIGDAVPFSAALRFGIEHGGANEWPGSYGSTAFWYGRELPAATVTDSVDVGDPASEAAHGYTGAAGEPGAVTTLTAVFEGDDDDVEVTDHGRATTDPVHFTVHTDRHHALVELRRRFDRAVSYQSADVYVDGRWAGRWLAPNGNPHQRWAEDTFALPPALTRGRSELEVRLEPAPGGPAWHAARYDVLSTA